MNCTMPIRRVTSVQVDIHMYKWTLTSVQVNVYMWTLTSVQVNVYMWTLTSIQVNVNIDICTSERVHVNIDICTSERVHVNIDIYTLYSGCKGGALLLVSPCWRSPQKHHHGWLGVKNQLSIHRNTIKVDWALKINYLSTETPSWLTGR